MGSIAREVDTLHIEIDRTTENVRVLKHESDDLLLRAIALAEKLGIDISDILSENPQEEVAELPAIIDEVGRIKFPRDYDFEEGFQKLVQEAHAAGFTDVHPEQLLTSEEIANAMAFSQQLDEEF